MVELLFGALFDEFRQISDGHFLGIPDIDRLPRPHGLAESAGAALRRYRGRRRNSGTACHPHKLRSGRYPKLASQSSASTIPYRPVWRGPTVLKKRATMTGWCFSFQ